MTPAERRERARNASRARLNPYRFTTADQVKGRIAQAKSRGPA